MSSEKKIHCDLCGHFEEKPFLEKDGGFYTKCSECGFVYTSPLTVDLTAHNDEYYKEATGKYLDKHFSEKNQRKCNLILKKFSAYRKSGKILEIGCNAGGFLHAATKKGWESYGIEPVSEVTEYGKKKFNLNIQNCFIEDAKLPENSFDVVYSNAVFEHLPSPSKAFEKVHSFLRIGGIAYIETVNIDSFTYQFLGKKWRLIDPLDHPSLYTPKTISNFASKSGLETKKIITRGLRFQPTDAPKLSGFKRLTEELLKFPYSIYSKLSLKGDRVILIAKKV